jgi:hypothetical protein
MMQFCVQQTDVVKLSSLWLCWPVFLATEILAQTGEQERYTFDRSVMSIAFFPYRQRGNIWLLEKATHFSCSSPDVFAILHIPLHHLLVLIRDKDVNDCILEVQLKRKTADAVEKPLRPML